MLDTLSQDAIQTAWLIARRFTDSSGLAVRLLQAHVKPSDTSTAYIADPGLRRVLLVNKRNRPFEITVPRFRRQSDGRWTFEEATAGEDRMTQAVTLFALLELYKTGELVWRQRETFGPIEIMSTTES